MGAGHLCKSQHNYTCNCVALSHHNLHGSSWARCAWWSTPSCAPPPSRRQPGRWSRGERIDCTPGSRSQLQPSARETWTESSTLPLFEDILDKCPYLLKISYAIVSQWNKLRQNASKHLERPCYPLMLHEQRTGVYYFSTVTKLLHFPAFTLLCLACVKAYNQQ